MNHLQDYEWLNRDLDTHMEITMEDVSRPSDSYSEPTHYTESAHYNKHKKINEEE